jgi:beta-lactamase class C
MKIKRLTLLISTILFTINVYAADVKTTVNTVIKPAITNYHVPGMAVAVFYQHKEYFYFYGWANKVTHVPMTKNTIFDLASVTKVFTSTLLARAIQSGNMQLNDAVVQYLPPLAQTKNLPIDQVTLKELATHTSSFPRDMTNFGVAANDYPAFLQSLKSWQPDIPIGTHFLYSNAGFGLLGAALSTATHTAYPQLLQQIILTPLAMKQTAINLSSQQLAAKAAGYKKLGAPAPSFISPNLLSAGSLHSTIGDMLIFLKANLGIGVSANLSSAMQYAQKNYFTVGPYFSMGLGWHRVLKNGNLFLFKNGFDPGFSAFIGFDPQQQFGIVILANQAKVPVIKLGVQILNQLGRPPTSSTSPTPDVLY